MTWTVVQVLIEHGLPVPLAPNLTVINTAYVGAEVPPPSLAISKPQA
jgi:hypothetical protein